MVHLINFSNEFTLKADGLTCIQTFCHISSGGISNTQTLLQAFLSQYWHTSFQLEKDVLMHMPLAYHIVIILHPVIIGKKWENLEINIFIGIKIPKAEILTNLILNLLECYIICLRPLKQYIFLEQTSQV